MDFWSILTRRCRPSASGRGANGSRSPGNRQSPVADQQYLDRCEVQQCQLDMGKQPVGRLQRIFTQSGRRSTRNGRALARVCTAISSSSPLPDETVFQVASYLIAPCYGGRASLRFLQIVLPLTLYSLAFSEYRVPALSPPEGCAVYSDPCRNHSALDLACTLHQTNPRPIIVNARQ